MADTLIKARELCDFDGIYVSRDNWIYHQALGGSMTFPDDDEPYSTEIVLNSLNEFKKLHVPDPQTTAGMKTVLKAARRVVKEVGEKYYIQANIDTGPFSMAGILRGVENFMFDLKSENEKDIHELLSFCTDVVIAYGEAMIETGVHGIQYGDSIASLISPDLYEKFVTPYQKKSINMLSGKGCDLWIHICGKTDHLLHFLKPLNIQGFEVDTQVEMLTARKLLGDHIALKGNIDTTFLLTDTPEAVYRATQNCIEKGNFKTGIILSPGCGVPRMTPLENLRAMTRACRDYTFQ
jgi:uroporphyrinogen decarboxylase